LKKIFPLLFSIVLLLALTACTVGGAAVDASSTNLAGTSLLSANYDNALSVPMQLIIGTLQLEGTPNQVDSQTAANLLPLWKAAQSLSNNSSTASVELEAVFNQIQETMTPNQIEAIAAMHLTQTDVAQATQALGLSAGFGSTDLTPSQRATAQANRQSAPGGGFLGGGFPGGGQPPDAGLIPGAGGGAFINPGNSNSGTGANAADRSQGGVPAPFYAAIIKYLEGKVSQ
jgi:hypothetical protein